MKEIASNETVCSIRHSFLRTIRLALRSNFITLCHSKTVLEDEQSISLAVVGGSILQQDLINFIRMVKGEMMSIFNAMKAIYERADHIKY